MAHDESDMSGGTGTSTLVETRPFEADTMEAVASVRGALGAMVAEIPGEIRRPRQLQKALGVDYKICWQVFNVIQAADPLTAAKHTPSAPALKRFLASGLRLGVSRSRVEAVQSAIEKFSHVIREHAADRNTFQSMVSAAAEEADPAQLLQHRRSSYRSMSQIWGAQVEAHLSVSLVRRSANVDGLDECSAAIKQGFQRLRADASPIVVGSRPSSEKVPDDKSTRQPLDAEAMKAHHAPLLPQFSSRPLPALRTEAGGAGWVYTKLASEGIGRQSRVNLAVGMASHGLPHTLDTDGRRIFRTGTTFRTPTALLVADVLIHRPTIGDVQPFAVAFQSMPGDEMAVVAKEAPQLQVNEKVIALGRADRAADSPEWPRYAELLNYLAAAVKWDLAEFDIFRLRVEYPVFGSVVRIQFHL